MILVTGGTGLVGSHLLLELTRAGKKVRAIYRSSNKLIAVQKVFSYYLPVTEAKFLFETIEWVEADITEIPSLNMAFLNITEVYHCAALISFNYKYAKKMRSINIEGTANIVNTCIKFNVNKLCYVSSIATLDLAIGEKAITENFTWYPEKDHSDYAISKHGGEIEVWRGTQEGLPAVIVNPGVILGPGFWNNGSGKIFTRIHNGLNYHFPKTTGFVGVQDVVKVMMSLMNSEIENEQFLLISENKSFKDVLELVAKSLQKKPPEKSLKPWMIYLGWIYQSISSTLWGAKKILSRTDAKTLFEHSFYNTYKIRNSLKFEFIPIAEVIKEAGLIFQKEHIK